MFSRRSLSFFWCALLACMLGRASMAATFTLEQAYDRTLETDQSIRTAYYEVRKANLLTWSALTRIAPSVSASPGLSRGASSINTPGALTSQNTRTGAANLDFTLTQTLIDLSVFPAFRLGKLSAQAALLARQYTIRQTLFGVVTAYYEVLKQRRLVEVDLGTLNLAQQQLDLAEKRLNVGEVARSDVLRARVAVETARRTWIADTNTLEVDRNTLRNILNLPADAELEVIEPAAYPTDLPAFDALLRRANQSREDLRVREIAVQQDTERKNEVLAEYAPRLNASASSGFNTVTGTSRSRQNNWEVQLGVEVPFFTGGQREIDLMTAKYQIEETRLDRETTAKQVEADVKQAWLDVKSLEGTLTALKVQVSAAEQSYHDLQIEYTEGVATSVDVLSALSDLNTSRKDLAVQSYQYQVALRNLEEVTGVFQEQRVRKSKIR